MQKVVREVSDFLEQEMRRIHDCLNKVREAPEPVVGEGGVRIRRRS